MKLILPIFAIICTVLATATSLTLCMAMGANSSPTALRVLKYSMIGVALIAVAGVAAGIYLIRAGHPGWAAGAAFAPTVIMVLSFLVALILKL